MLKYLTAGESHGPQITAIVQGIPAGLPLGKEFIDRELARRQGGYGRGGRMKIERDQVVINAGVRAGEALGSPIALIIANRDWVNWQRVMFSGPEADISSPLVRPRPGHADLAGGLKYNHHDLRNVLERASARETAARVAVGAVCKQLLSAFNIQALSWVVEIGSVKTQRRQLPTEELFRQAESSPVRCPDPEASKQMMALIDKANETGDTLGGVFEVIVVNPPVGLGSFEQWDSKLDGRLAQGLMSIQAIKGVEVGVGFRGSRMFGSQVHDAIAYSEGKRRFYRLGNHAGGIEGGITNGENIVLRAAMKPIPTLRRPLSSVDITTKEEVEASYERSDICAVPAAAVIGEAVVAYEIARSMCEKFGGDSLEEMRRNYAAYLKQISEY